MGPSGPSARGAEDAAFADHIAVWDRLAEEDPFWAVLSDPAKRGGGWDADAFFATGREHVGVLEQDLGALGHSFAGRRVLDFGCGLGRLTQAAAATASFSLGVDAAVGMVVGAQRWNRFPDRCAYLLNRAPDLGMLPDRSFGAVLSFIVLQHIPPPASTRYLAELARVVAPGGFLVVQAPAEVVAADLPAAAFRASVRPLQPPVQLAAGAAADVVVEVVNASQERWQAWPPTRLRVGNHWLPLDGGPSVRDDGRVVLDPLGPGEVGVVHLPVAAPVLPGRYRLEVDVVVEGQAWFADMGSAPGGAEVRVVPPGDAPPGPELDTPGDGAPPATFGMWGIGRNEVQRILEEAGLRLLLVSPDGSSGEAWTSWRYIATRP